MEVAARDQARLDRPPRQVAGEEVADLQLELTGHRALARRLEVQPVPRHGVVAGSHVDSGVDLELGDALEAALGREAELVLRLQLDLEPAHRNLPRVLLVSRGRGQRRVEPHRHAPQEATTAPRVLGLPCVLADSRPPHEAELRVEARADGVGRELVLPGAGLHLGGDPVRVAVSARAVVLARHPVANDARGAPLAEEPAVLPAEVGAVGGRVSGAYRSPPGGDHADRRLGADVSTDANHAEGLLWIGGGLIDQSTERPDVPGPGAPGELDAAEYRYRVAVVVEADAPREERDRVRAAPEARRATELEQPGVLQKEVALLREEQRKAREIDLSLVDFGLGEVGVVGQQHLERRRDAVLQVETEVSGARGVLADRAIARRLELGVRHDVDADPLLHPLETDQCPASGQVEERVRHQRRRPARSLAVRLASPGEVETPRRLPLRKAECLVRQRHLGLPAARRHARPTVPDAVPPLVEAVAAVADQRVTLAAAGADLEPEGRALGVVGVDPDLDAVVRIEPGVARHQARADLPGLVMHSIAM